MTRHLSLHNLIAVPVLDCNGNPLAPTRPSRARRWLESGRAVKVWRNQHFAIQLLDTDVQDCTIPDMALNIDPGYRTTGIAIVIVKPEASVQVIAGYELPHRGKYIVAQMLSRRSHRRNRRSRLRRRPARFSNRRRTKDWLPPSLESTLTNILTTIRHLMGIYPIAAINIESCKFDPRLLRNPEVHGKEYQSSEPGQMQIREYVLQRDHRTCQYCGKRNRRLAVDHVVPKSRGGPYRVSNLITACRDCNQRKDSRSVREFLAAEPQKLRRVLRQLKQTLTSAAHMNRLMPLLITRVSSNIRMCKSSKLELTHLRMVASSADFLRRCTGQIAKGGTSERDIRVERRWPFDPGDCSGVGARTEHGAPVSEVTGGDTAQAAIPTRVEVGSLHRAH